MKMLLVREWEQIKRKWCVQLLIQIIVIVGVFFLYGKAKSVLEHVMTSMMKTPVEYVALMGLHASVDMTNLSFYMKYVLMFLNFCFFWSWGNWILERIWQEESCRCVQSIERQEANAVQIVLAKCIWLVIVSVVYLVAILGLAAFLVQKSAESEGIAIDLGAQILAMRGPVFGVLIFMFSICLVRGLISAPDDAYQWCWDVTILTLFAGNVYKIRDVLIWMFMVLKQESLMYFLQDHGGFLNKGFWLSPLSWINPFTIQSADQVQTQSMICYIGTVVLLAVGCLVYSKRKHI